MGSYNLIFDNCEDFAIRLSREISDMVPKVEFNELAAMMGDAVEVAPGYSYTEVPRKRKED